MDSCVVSECANPRRLQKEQKWNYDHLRSFFSWQFALSLISWLGSGRSVGRFFILIYHRSHPIITNKQKQKVNFSRHEINFRGPDFTCRRHNEYRWLHTITHSSLGIKYSLLPTWCNSSTCAREIVPQLVSWWGLEIRKVVCIENHPTSSTFFINVVSKETFHFPPLRQKVAMSMYVCVCVWKKGLIAADKWIKTSVKVAGATQEDDDAQQ